MVKPNRMANYLWRKTESAVKLFSSIYCIIRDALYFWQEAGRAVSFPGYNTAPIGQCRAIIRQSQSTDMN